MTYLTPLGHGGAPLTALLTPCRLPAREQCAKSRRYQYRAACLHICTTNSTTVLLGMPTAWRLMPWHKGLTSCRRRKCCEPRCWFLFLYKSFSRYCISRLRSGLVRLPCTRMKASHWIPFSKTLSLSYDTIAIDNAERPTCMSTRFTECMSPGVMYSTDVSQRWPSISLKCHTILCVLLRVHVMLWVLQWCFTELTDLVRNFPRQSSADSLASFESESNSLQDRGACVYSSGS